MRDRWTGGRALALRLLGVGLASALAVVTLVLWATGNIGLYINPDAAWWAVSMAIVLLVGAVASCAVPIDRGGHAHAGDAEHPPAAHAHDTAAVPGTGSRRSVLALGATGAGAVLATGFVALAVVLPPASLSAELALERSSGAVPVLTTSATLALASSDDTSSFGVGEWASVLSTSTDPARFVGEPALLTGFVAPADDGFRLTRLVIVHCVIDAQAASVPVSLAPGVPDFAPGEWVEVAGEFARSAAGGLVLEPVSIIPVAEPEDPYEY